MNRLHRLLPPKVETLKASLTSDSQDHASNLVAYRVAGCTLVASSICRARVPHLQEALRTDVELSTFCHLYSILKQRNKDALSPNPFPDVTSEQRPFH